RRTTHTPMPVKPESGRRSSSRLGIAWTLEFDTCYRKDGGRLAVHLAGLEALFFHTCQRRLREDGVVRFRHDRRNNLTLVVDDVEDRYDPRKAAAADENWRRRERSRPLGKNESLALGDIDHLVGLAVVLVRELIERRALAVDVVEHRRLLRDRRP